MPAAWRGADQIKLPPCPPVPLPRVTKVVVDRTRSAGVALPAEEHNHLSPGVVSHGVAGSLTGSDRSRLRPTVPVPNPSRLHVVVAVGIAAEEDHFPASRIGGHRVPEARGGPLPCRQLPFLAVPMPGVAVYCGAPGLIGNAPEQQSPRAGGVINNRRPSAVTQCILVQFEPSVSVPLPRTPAEEDGFAPLRVVSHSPRCRRVIPLRILHGPFSCFKQPGCTGGAEDHHRLPCSVVSHRHK
jgi:hypothetical protein